MVAYNYPLMGASTFELIKLADLHSSGVITDAEFQQQKAGLLA